MKITVLGGDRRSLKLIELLAVENHQITAYGFNDTELDTQALSKDLMSAVEGSKIIIGPIPCIKDEIYLNTPNYEGYIEIKDVFENMKENQIFIAGSIPEKIKELADSYNIRRFDLFDREEMAVLNALPTAEGAIEIAMKEMDTIIQEANIMILGFGRIGKVLSKMLQGMGNNPYVVARKYSDLAWIRAYGYRPVELCKIDEYLRKTDLVFNTIPHLILDEEKLLKMKKDVTIIDLASKPGGTDFRSAEELGIKAIWALALPGKVAPKTAANIIKSTIYNIMEEMED